MTECICIDVSVQINVPVPLRHPEKTFVLLPCFKWIGFSDVANSIEPTHTNTILESRGSHPKVWDVCLKIHN